MPQILRGVTKDTWQQRERKVEVMRSEFPAELISMGRNSVSQEHGFRNQA